jgi:hypothetical protein
LLALSFKKVELNRLCGLREIINIKIALKKTELVELPLSDTVQFNNFIATVCLPQKSYEEVVVSGTIVALPPIRLA